MNQTWSDVVKIFDELGLPVCDDTAIIKAAVDKKTPRYLMDARSANPEVSARARANMRNAQALLDPKSREQHLEIVYRSIEEFLLGLLAAAGGGAGAGIGLVLENHAKSEKKCHLDLARLWVQRLLKGKPITPPEITDLKGFNGFPRVRLEWSMPPYCCDHVEILRESKTVGSYKGGNAFDTPPTPGWSEYEVRAVWNLARGKENRVRVLCLDEVRDAVATVHGADRKITLAWTLPYPGARIYVFRRVGAAAACTVHGQALVPVGTGCAMVVQDVATWTESITQTGIEIHYLVVVHDGQGCATPGKALRVQLPHPPPPPVSAGATYTCPAAGEKVEVAWKPSPTSGCQYRVVRKPGALPPGSLTDGVSSPLLTGLTWIDTLADPLVPGRQYSYGIFALMAGMPSVSAASTPPVTILREISDLSISAATGGAQLSWTPPAGVVEVVVRRGDSPPRNETDGIELPVRNLREANDPDLEEGRTYYYTVFTVYLLPGHRRAVSMGIVEKVVPSRPPCLPGRFEVRSEGGAVHCVWDAPPGGTVEVRRSASDLNAFGGKLLDRAELHTCLKLCDGALLVHTGTLAVDRKPDGAFPFYTVIVRNGGLAIVGESVECHVCEPVQGLDVTPGQGKALALRWAFPAGCAAVRLLARWDAWPTGPGDPAAEGRWVTKSEYENCGGVYRFEVPKGNGDLHVVVLARHFNPRGTAIFASAGDPASRCGPVAYGEPIEVTYGIRRKMFGAGRHVLHARVVGLRIAFRGFVLIAAEGAPEAQDDGVEVARWCPAPAGTSAVTGDQPLDLEALQRHGWKNFHVRLFAIDPGQSRWCRFVPPRSVEVTL